jgi:hypothetical protein
MVEDGKNRAKTFSKFLCEHEQLNKGQFGFGESPKPKREIYQQMLARARQDGLISDLHYDNKRIRDIAIELANEFETFKDWDIRFAGWIQWYITLSTPAMRTAAPEIRTLEITIL